MGMQPSKRKGICPSDQEGGGTERANAESKRPGPPRLRMLPRHRGPSRAEVEVSPKRKTPATPQAKSSARCTLPMQLHVGDRFTDEEGESKITARPWTTHGGKMVHARFLNAFYTAARLRMNLLRFQNSPIPTRPEPRRASVPGSGSWARISPPGLVTVWIFK